MQITDVLAQMGGLQSIARELGVSEAQAATAGADALLPAILGGFKKQAQAQDPPGSTGWAACSANWAAAGCSTTCCRRSPPTWARATTCSARSSAPRT